MWKRSVVWVSLLLAGCATSRPAPSSSTLASSSSSPASDPTPQTQPTIGSSEPVSRQVARASEKLHGKRFSGLLHFERPADALFVSAEPSAPRIDAGAAHTGKSSLRLAPGTRRLTFKLSSMLAGRDFPGDWTLVGAYVWSDEAAGVALSCTEDGKPVAGRKVVLEPGQWTPVMLDVSALPAGARGAVTLELRFDRPTSGDVRCDDALLIDNRETLLDESPDGWTVKRAGFRIACERKQRFTFAVVTADGSPNGWSVEEVNALRARFSSGGKTKALTVYADGRSIWDGAYKPLSAEVRDDRAFAAAHGSPAEIAVPETMGRVNRNTPGDANNDGYNERLGAYQVQATGGRVELTITPRSTAAPRPVLQIAGMPEGRALITIEGRLVERSTRLADGQLLVELPARITRGTLVSIRIL
jgi:hypothetical protein